MSYWWKYISQITSFKTSVEQLRNKTERCQQNIKEWIQAIRSEQKCQLLIIFFSSFLVTQGMSSTNAAMIEENWRKREVKRPQLNVHLLKLQSSTEIWNCEHRLAIVNFKPGYVAAQERFRNSQTKKYFFKICSILNWLHYTEEI